MFNSFETTGIGSLPFLSPEEAVALVLEHCDIPFWPQLPKASFRELMVPQYSEGLPSVVIDSEAEKVYLEELSQQSLNRFYEAVSDGHLFPISREFARGFYAFEEALQKRGEKYRILKGQITGPLTFTLSIKLSDNRYIYFDEELREVALMLLQKKAQWQIERLSQYADKVLIFIDEPILTAIGSSSYLGVEPSEAERLLTETVQAIKQSGGISGIHSCGKAEWGMLMKTGVDVLNFDAYDYFDNLSIYTDDLKEFFQRGGYLAWGIVPTTEAINDVDLEKLKKILSEEIDKLTSTISEDLIISHSILTPSCGAGSRTEEEARKVFQLLKALSEEIRK